MDEDKLIRLITDQLTPEEKSEVLDWIFSSTENREKYYQLKNTWSLTDQHDISVELVEDDLNQFRKNIRKNRNLKIKRQVFTVLKYAAILIVAIIIGRFIYTPPPVQKQETTIAYNVVTVPPGQMAQITLSDGTSVYLNACSSLKYPSLFNQKERNVYLSGEAFFEVSKNTIPFVVETENRTIKVLGTRFNIMSYPGDHIFQATLVEGKISLGLKTDQKEIKSLEIKPGEQYSWNKTTDKYQINKVNTTLFDSWKDGLYTFDHETLNGIADKLERIFAVKVKIKNEKIGNYKFTGTISRNVPFEQILKIIQISAPIKYHLKETNGAIEEVILF